MGLPDLSQRELAGEMMDDPALSPDRHAAALRGLARLNRVAGAARLLWPVLLAEARSAGSRPLRVLDLATGSGDVPISLMRCARRRGVQMQIDGCDLRPRAIDIAAVQAVRAGVCAEGERRFFVLDVLHEPLPEGYDVVMCSLFMHHLEDEQVMEVLYKMRCASGHLVLVSDLERRRVGFALAWSASRVLTRSEVVRTDALRSVRAAFTIEEFAGLAVAAGLDGARLRRRWPCRFVLEWGKS